MPKILFIDDDLNTLESCARLSKTAKWDFLTATNAHEALAIAQEHALACIVADQSLPDMTGTELLHQVRAVSPLASRLLLTGSMTSQLLQQAVNKAGVFKYILKPWEAAGLVADIEEAIAHHQSLVERKSLIAEFKEQNSQLESMAQGLESIVTERTRDLEQSRREAEDKLSHQRGLVHFLHRLSLVGSFEDLVVLLRKELRTLSGVEDHFLITYQTQKSVLHYQQAGRGYKKNIQLNPLESFEYRWANTEEQKILADHLDRPVGKILFFPLYSQGKCKTIILAEIGHVQFDMEQFRRIVDERARAITICADKIILDSDLDLASQQWSRIFDSVKNPISLIGRDYNVIRANRAFTSIAGEGDSFKQFSNAVVAIEGSLVKKAFTTGQMQKGIVRHHNEVFDVYSYPLPTSTDGVACVINYYANMTRERQLKGKMFQSEKIAAIGMLAGNIAHELNNPLTGIRSLTQILLHESHAATLTEDLREIEKASERCQTIIQNLLEFSRGNLQDSNQLVAVNQLIKKTLPMLKMAMRSHSSQIELGDEERMVRCEPQLLQQVIFNLVTNACQAMVDSGIITIKTKVIIENNQEWFLVVVADSGVGIEAHNLPLIFEPFFTTKPLGQGTGLGLSITKSIVEQIGGSISVKSELNRGSEFTVRLPTAIITQAELS